MFKPIDLPKAYEPILGDLTAAFEGFIKNGEYIGGEYVKRFEELVKHDIGANFVVGCKSGTHALQLALISAGVGPGDEVITVANTYYATAYAIKSIGAVPVFCDVNGKNGLLDLTEITACITSKTKAVIPVHLYGIAIDIIKLETICSSYGLKLIEDCSHAYGSKHKSAYIGQHSEYACFSLYPTKNLGAFGDAGMILTRSEDAALMMRELLYLSDKSRTRYNPLSIHARLDAIQACLLSVVIEKLVHKFSYQRALIRDHYLKLLATQPGIKMLIAEWNDVIPYVFPVYAENRDGLLAFFRDCKNLHFPIHYSTNLHCLKQFGGMAAETLPVTNMHNSSIFTLPLNPSMTTENVEEICKAIKEFYDS